MDNEVHKKKREVNPRENANILSLALFIFAFKTLRKGFREGIADEDIYEILKDYRSDNLGDKLENEWEKEKKKSKYLLLGCLWKIYGCQYVILAIILLAVDAPIMIIETWCTGKVVSYFEPRTKLTRNDALMYTTGLVGCSLAFTFFDNIFLLLLEQLSMKIRISCASLLYRKCLKLNLCVLSRFTNGSIVTLLSKDVFAFDMAVHYGQMMFAGTVEVIILTVLMYREIGVASIYGSSLLFVLLPIQAYLGYKTSKYRLRTAKKTDQRVRITQEILTAMRIIKMYTWELFFAKSVNKLRKKELRYLRILFYLKSICISIGELTTRLAMYICVIAYVGFGNHITAEKAFLVAGTFGALRMILHIFMPMGISQMAELVASLQRITNFLKMEEVPEIPNVVYIEEKEPRIYIQDATVKSDTGDNILENINLDIKRGLTILTGSVGAGKSTLFKFLLSDVKKHEGTVDISGKMSYVSQEPWLFPGTVRQNILFGERFDENRYETIIKVCALKKDFNALPEGDNTFLTDKGLNLSGGQKARINLARAIYKMADIYLLDNCLSSVDGHVGKHIFHECIKGFLKDKICILVTHYDQFLQEANEIVLLDKGTIISQGHYANFKEHHEEFMSTVKDYEQTEERCAKVEEAIKEKFASNDDNAEETSKLLLSRVPTKKYIYEESKEEGGVRKEVYFKYFVSGGGIKMLTLLVVLSIVAQVAISWSDYFVSFWVDMEQDLSGFRHNHTTDSPEYKLLEESHDSVMKLYSFVILAATAFTLLNTLAFFTFATLASKNIHNSMSEKVLSAAMIFFDTHLSGNILNRFSRDLGILDELMPYTVYEVAKMILTLTATLSVVSSVNLFFIIPSIIYVIIVIIARQLYIPTGRSLKRLEGATRSPVVGHLNATLEGLTTIRASQVQEILKKEFDRHQDHYNSVFYMHMAATRAFSFYLETLSSCYITVITLTFLFIKTETLAGQVGLAITQSFSLTGILQWGVRNWADLENQMTSTERVLEYSKIEPEEKSGDKLRNWPNNGKIVYSSVSLRYGSTSKRVLKDVSFSVLPKQKIGIVGRTGAGKSSIVSTLFRMYEYKGSISIDAVDVNSVDLELLRSKISIIPQDPVLFSGTVRSNLDPNTEFSDNDLWEALEEVEMKSLVGSLNSTISEGGANFSIGQRQLLCLARAIVRNNTILILDEATANVDPQTDSLIQKTIKAKFSDCTIITIAHKLNTIMESDNVLVMDSGVAVEYDHPKALLENKGMFYNMVKEAGLL